MTDLEITKLCDVACGYDSSHGIEGNNLSNVIGRRILVTGRNNYG